MQEIIIALISALSTIVVAFVGIRGAKKFNLTGMSTGKLVTTLRDIVEAQNVKIALIEQSNKELKDDNKELKEKVQKLEDLTIEQAGELAALRRQRAPRRGSVTN